jgi:glycosyltransferase involved in cell wall biosynthesis
MTATKAGDRLTWLVMAAHVPPTGTGGGMVRYVVEFTRALSGVEGVEAHVLARPESAAFFEELVGATRQVHRARFSKAPVPAQAALERLGWTLPVLRSGFDVVHGMKHLLPRRVENTRVLTVHDMLPLDRPSDFGTAKRRLLRGPYLRSIAEAHVIAAVSRATVDRLTSYVPDACDRAVVVPLAVPRSLTNAMSEQPSKVAPGLFALVVGDTSGRKNVGFLVDLWPDVLARVPGARLVIVGPPGWSGSHVGERFTELNASGHVVHVGHVSDGELRWLYEHAGVALCPSLLEGFGIPSAEAVSFGARVIISDDPAMADAAGIGATRVGSGDIAGWASAIAAALHDAARPLPPAGPARTWDSVARETVEAVRRHRARTS